MLPTAAAAVSSGAERPSRPKVPSAVRSASWTHGCHWRPGPCRVAALLLGCCLLGAAAGYASVSSGSKEQAGRGRTVALQRKFWQRMRDAMRTGKDPAVAASSDSSETNATDMSLDGKPKLGPRQPNTLTGVFYDESFEVRGSWKGLRVLGGPAGAAPGNGITVLGTDDGSSFYSLRGSFLGDEEVLVDFTPIGGPEYRRGIWTDQAIRWYGVARGMGERDVWTLRPGLLSKMRPLLGSAPLPKRLEGVFTDRKHFIAGTWAGYRFINEEKLSEGPGLSEEWADFLGASKKEGIVLIGTDNGVDFWSLRGLVLAREQAVEGRRGRSGVVSFVVDFSPKGGPKMLYGKFANGKITWQDDNYWTLVVPR